MDLAWLAAKEKRLKYWKEFVEDGGVPDFSLKQTTLTKLNELQQLLGALWEKGGSSPEEAKQLANLERELEDLNEQARLNSFHGASIAGEKS
jgi:hypothetical protein